MTVAGEDHNTPAVAHELRTYGRRRGRRLSPRQQRLVDEALPRLRVDLGGPLPWPGTQAVWLEIGFGGAEHLIAQAEANPDVAFIGCEPFQDGIVKALAAIEERSLENVRLYDGDAREVLRWLPEGRLARVFVLFPDPWPKRRHAKRRLVSPTTVALLADRMTEGGELRVATDIAQYARVVLSAVAQEPRLMWLAERPDDWRNRTDDWPMTRYEAKALRVGRRCTYFRFKKVHAA
jgi:tRNA (guanine-N7-)-methyltransferase